MDKFLVLSLAVLGAVVLVVGLGLLFAYPLMCLTNYLFAASFLMTVFGIAKLTFWKAYCLSVLASWLFKTTTTTTKK